MKWNNGITLSHKQSCTIHCALPAMNKLHIFTVPLSFSLKWYIPFPTLRRGYFLTISMCVCVCCTKGPMIGVLFAVAMVTCS